MKKKIDIVDIKNADFMNKYRPDLLWNEYKLGCGKSYTRLNAHFKDLERNDKK